MNAPQHSAQFTRRLPTVVELEQTVEATRAVANRPEPLWLSATLTLGVGIVFVALVVARAWLG
ncbi:hypothetical protein ABIC16_002223 [Sphingomonas sp. PvP055]|uniref:hypothetical protein n=1 Tax=Sphingomonas sp. PvP055 TaxID=3156391 RepID=UPI0033948EB2